MGENLTNKQIRETFTWCLHVSSPTLSELKTVSLGNGTDSALSISENSVTVDGDLEVTGSITNGELLKIPSKSAKDFYATLNYQKRDIWSSRKLLHAWEGGDYDATTNTLNDLVGDAHLSSFGASHPIKDGKFLQFNGIDNGLEVDTSTLTENIGTKSEFVIYSVVRCDDLNKPGYGVCLNAASNAKIVTAYRNHGVGIVGAYDSAGIVISSGGDTKNHFISDGEIWVAAIRIRRSAQEATLFSEGHGISKTVSGVTIPTNTKLSIGLNNRNSPSWGADSFIAGFITEAMDDEEIHKCIAGLFEQYVEKKPVNTFLMGGQSNMEGSNTQGAFVSTTYTDMGLIGRFNDRDGRIVQTVEKENNNWGVPELFIGEYAERSGQPLVVISNAKGGTNITAWLSGGSQYSDASFYQQSSLQSIIGLGHNPIIRGYIWWQGESDTYNQGDADSYLANLKQHALNVRVSTGIPNLPFIVIRINWPATGADYEATVRAAQEQFVEEDHNAYMINADDIETEHSSGIDPGNYHGTANGYQTIAERVADLF